ncbi:hypothetical protein ACWCQW_07460 [Streptomyces mirabilis]
MLCEKIVGSISGGIAREKAGLPPLFLASLSTNDPNIRFFYSFH